MKAIQPTGNAHNWPRHSVPSVECRKKDLVIRIANWMRDREEPAFDVEVYIGGVYDWNESETFTKREFKTGRECKARAVAFAQAQILKLL